MRKGKLPKTKSLQIQTGAILWFGDEDTTNAEFNPSLLKDGDELFWVQGETKTRMGFIKGHGSGKHYYKESTRRYVILPRWWYSQVKATPGEVAICVGGKAIPSTILDPPL